MKKQLLFLLLLVFTGLNAQIVTIPDAEFKAYLLAAQGKNSTGQTILINANQDNEIQLSEALAVWEVNISGYSISTTSLLGIEAFTNLRNLTIEDFPNLPDVNLIQLINLKSLSITDSVINELHINGLSNLETFNVSMVSGGFLNGLNVSGLTGLKAFYNDSSSFSNIDFTQLTGLETIGLGDACTDLIDLSNCYELQSLNIGTCPSFPTITLGSKPNLHTLRFSGIYLNNDQAYTLDLTGCTALTDLKLDFGDWAGAPVFINLKNGIANYESLILNFMSIDYAPLYICIDEGNEGLIPAQDTNNTHMFVSTYCNFTPGGTYNTLSGTFNLDADNNGCDDNDAIINFSRIDIVTENEEEFSVFCNNSGVYNFYWGAGTFTIMPVIENSDWFIINPSLSTINFPDNNNITNTQNFCVTANGVHPDLEVVVASGGAQPGFDAYYTVTFKNKGNQQLSGTITLTYDDTVLDFINANNGGTDTAGTISWSYSNLQPFESRQVAAVLNVNSPMETPAVNIDDILNFTATITPTAGDETPADNTFNLNQIVTGSYDPNDITCLEGESVAPEQIGEYLHYNINFENTGNAPATFIAVKNTLNPEQFDPSTLQLLYASHDVETRLSGNELEFYFGNINLAANGGKGNVVYKIKTNNTLQVNDDVAQQANIYFDYNWPIQTNEAVTTFETLSSGIHTKDNSIKLYPNPSTGIVTITAATEIETVEMYDIQGRLLQVSHTATLDITQRQSGVYFMKVATEKGCNVQKLVKN